MTTDKEPTLMGRDVLDIIEHSDPERAVRWLREANDYYTAKYGNRETGTVWTFQVGPGELAETLLAGIRVDRGWVAWSHGNEYLIPAEGGLNEDWVDYSTWFGYDAGGAPPGSELPIEEVYELLAEFVRTARRPTGIEWRPAPEEESTADSMAELAAASFGIAADQFTLIGRHYLDIVEHNDPEHVVALLREANNLQDRIVEERGFGGGTRLVFRAGQWWTGVQELLVGVRGDRGAIQWSQGDDFLVPAEGGLNNDWEKYWSWTGDLWGAEPGTELPIEQVYELLAEFVRTAERPTSIQWRPVDEQASNEWYAHNFANDENDNK